MLNFTRPNQKIDAKDADKPGLRPAVYEPPVSRPNSLASAAGTARTTPSQASTHAADAAAASSSPTMTASGMTMTSAQKETPGSKLSVGINIKLKGVEISDCDILVIEGQVEATVNSKVMEIAKPGTLKGTALIDVAEIHGDFSGDLTARTRLIVHGTGRVSGTIRYGKLIVEEGGELSGDVKRLDSADDAAHPARSAPHARHVLSPESPSGSH